MRRATLVAGAVGAAAALATVAIVSCTSPEVRPTPPDPVHPTPRVERVEPKPPDRPAAEAPKGKPLSPAVEKGLAWLLARQQPDGGWSQGEESSNMGHGMDGVRDESNVADTCMGALALLRAGSTPASGPHAEAIRKALAYVCKEVEAAPEAGLAVTSIQGTRVQGKIGQYVDTFLSAMLLAETRKKMPDETGNARVAAALDKVMDKIEKNQQQNGGWQNEGWAPVLSTGIAAKAMNRAIQNGAQVDAATLARVEASAREQMKTGQSGGGDAGVALYAQSSSFSTIADTNGNREELERQYQVKLKDAKTEGEKRDAEQGLAQVRSSAVAEEQARGAIVARLDDAGFVSGFGSNGGEEFLSYMNISESLAQKGGEEWAKWDKSMSENLNRIQNDDGSWSGHHCITGRTFCTSAALLVLTADRAPFPVAERVARR